MENSEYLAMLDSISAKAKQAHVVATLLGDKFEDKAEMDYTDTLISHALWVITDLMDGIGAELDKDSKRRHPDEYE